MTPSRPPAPRPRWTVLATLVAGVLGLHLVLLAGGLQLQLPGLSSQDQAPQTTSAPFLAVPVHADNAPPMRVSSVRWTPQPAAQAPQQKAATRPAVARAAPAVTTPAVDLPAEPLADVALEPATTAPWAADAAVSDTDRTEDDAVLLAAAPSAPALLPAGATPLPPAQPPANAHLRYDVTGSAKGISYRAQGTLDWSVADGRYEARMEMRIPLLGGRSQTSTGKLGPGGLMPERFADQSRSEKAAHFDAAQQRIRFSSNAPEVPLEPGAQDRLSLFLQLASLLQARPQAYAAGQTIDMQVAGTGDAPTWRFEVGEDSTLSLPAGQIAVRHLKRLPRKEFDSTVEMWLAPSLGHLPVRLRITQPNGDVADQRLSQMP